MLIDLECPIEMRKYEIARDDRGNVRAYVQLFNLLDERVGAIDAIVKWVCGAEEYSERFTAGSLNVSARSFFSVSFLSAIGRDADRIEIAFERVSFIEKGWDWNADLSRVIEVPDTSAAGGKELNALMAVAGRDAVMFAEETKDYWLCVCGRANALTRVQCLRCHRDKASVFALSVEAVMSGSAPWLPESLRPDPIEAEPPFDLQREAIADRADEVAQTHSHRSTMLRQRKYLIRRTVSLIVIVALVALGYWAWGWLDYYKNRVGEVIPPVKISDYE